MTVRSSAVSTSAKFVGTAVFAVALLLTGCSGDDGGGKPGAGDSGASAAEPGDEVTPEQLAERVQAAVADKKTVKVRLQGSDSGGEEATGSLRFGDDFAMSLHMPSPDGDMRMLILKDAMYVATPIVEGKQWIKLGGTDDTFGKMFSTIVDGARTNVDFGRQAAAISKADSVTVEGSATVDGARTTKYVLKLGEEALKAQLSKELLDAGGDQLKGATATTELYLDEANLPRQVVTVAKIGAATTTSTVHYSDWGQPVSISEPSPDEVASGDELGDMSELLNAIQGQ